MPSLDVTIQAQGRRAIELTGTVDSGATSTALTLKVAELLGLRADDLRKAKPVLVADDSEVSSWTTSVPIRAQVRSQSSPGGAMYPWGPTFELHPVFLEHGSPLWGQADFFATFRVILARDVNPSWFELGY